MERFGASVHGQTEGLSALAGCANELRLARRYGIETEDGGGVDEDECGVSCAGRNRTVDLTERLGTVSGTRRSRDLFESHQSLKIEYAVLLAAVLLLLLQQCFPMLRYLHRIALSGPVVFGDSECIKRPLHSDRQSNFNSSITGYIKINPITLTST